MVEQQEEIESPFQRRSVQLTLAGLVLIVMAAVVIHDRGFSGRWQRRPPNPLLRALGDGQRSELLIRIDLNAATVRELSLIPGIGQVLARRILADRQRNGQFRSLQDLGRVHGIGPKTIREIESMCFVAETRSIGVQHDASQQERGDPLDATAPDEG